MLLAPCRILKPCSSRSLLKNWRVGTLAPCPNLLLSHDDQHGYLLDSHVLLLWWWFDPQRLPEGVLALFPNAETPVVVSSATTWELSIKQSSSRLFGSRQIRNLRPSLAANVGRVDQRLC